MGTPYWIEYTAQASPTNFTPSVGIPINTVLMMQATRAGDRLIRTVTDVEFVITAEDNGVTRMPFGIAATASGAVSVWADVTGTVPSFLVPQPFTTTVRPFPLWESQLYGAHVFESSGTKLGWTARLRPLSRMDSEAQRSWVGPGVTSVWANIQGIVFPWLTAGSVATYSYSLSSKSLFMPM